MRDVEEACRSSGRWRRQQRYGGGTREIGRGGKYRRDEEEAEGKLDR